MYKYLFSNNRDFSDANIDRWTKKLVSVIILNLSFYLITQTTAIEDIKSQHKCGWEIHLWSCMRLVWRPLKAMCRECRKFIKSRVWGLVGCKPEQFVRWMGRLPKFARDISVIYLHFYSHILVNMLQKFHLFILFIV